MIVVMIDVMIDVMTIGVEHHGNSKYTDIPNVDYPRHDDVTGKS